MNFSNIKIKKNNLFEKLIYNTRIFALILLRRVYSKLVFLAYKGGGSADFEDHQVGK